MHFAKTDFGEQARAAENQSDRPRGLHRQVSGFRCAVMAGEADTPTTLDFNYLKSRDFREASCDGVVGGPTPAGKLWMAFFTERLPLPKRVRHSIQSTGAANEFTLVPDAEPTLIDSLSGVVRNVEFGLYLDLSTAEQLHEWLGRKIETLKNEAAQ